MQRHASLFSSVMLMKLCQGMLYLHMQLAKLPCPALWAVADRVAGARLLVDEYQQSKDGSYHLTSMATDMFRMMRREGLRVSLVPDVMAATTGVYNGSRGTPLAFDNQGWQA